MKIKIREFFVFIVSLFFFIISSSCATELINVKEAKNVDNIKIYSNFVSIRYGFSVDIPQGFEMDGMEGRLTSWSYRKKPSEDEGEAGYDFGAVLPNISVITKDIPKDYSEVSVFNANLKKIEGEMADKTSNYTDLEILEFPGGYALKYKEIKRDDPNAINHHFLYIFKNRRHYILDISATYDVMIDWRHYFDHVLKSLTLN